jgi:hypothetical protein
VQLVHQASLAPPVQLTDTVEPFDITAGVGKNKYEFKGNDQSNGAWWSNDTTKGKDPWLSSQ